MLKRWEGEEEKKRSHKGEKWRSVLVRKRKAILREGFLEERWKNLEGLEWELVEWEMDVESSFS